jgi:hypothetical protein
MLCSISLAIIMVAVHECWANLPDLSDRCQAEDRFRADVRFRMTAQRISRRSPGHVDGARITTAYDPVVFFEGNWLDRRLVDCYDASVR